jgi:tripartite-type tricarboxylate transporter receptor subunit TctC
MAAALARLTLVAVTALALLGCARSPSAAPGAADSAAPASAPAAPAAKPAAKAPAQPAAGAAAAPADYFAGKTITMLVNFTAGGPTDIFARMIAPYVEKHIPGRPKVIVENRAGAGGVIGANQLYHAQRKDGLTIGALTSPFSAQVIQGEGVQYDSAGFIWLAGVNESQISYASTSLGIRSARELPQARGEIVVGGLSPDNSKDMAMRTFLNMMAVPYRYVTGYPGQADVVLAFKRGEVNYGEDSLTSYAASVVPMIRDGQAVPMGQRGIVKGGEIVRDPRAADVPTFFESALELRGESVRQTVDWRAMRMLVELGTMLRAIVYPPGTDPALVEVMRKVMADTFADPELHAAAEKQLGFQFEPVPGAEAQALAQKIIETARDDPEPVEYLRRQAAEKR